MDITTSQVIAWNLRRARNLRVLTQEQVAALLARTLGEQWSVATYSAAERSVAGQRVRRFTVEELQAFCDAFDLPIAFFLTPPPGTEKVFVRGADEGLDVERLAEIAGTPSKRHADRIDDLKRRQLTALGFDVQEQDNWITADYKGQR